MHRQFDVINPVDNLIGHVDGEISRVVGIVVFGAHALVDEQAKMGVVDLHNRNPILPQQFDLTS